jgi:Uma2 family endonuclease
MATQPVPRPATYDDLLRVPDHRVAEILDGELIVSPRPASRHALAGTRLTGDLSGPFDRGRGGPGGWWIVAEPELHLGADVVVPDLAGWRRERLPRYPDAAFFTLAPDWACEIVSPSSERRDRIQKMALYAREQVRHLWLLSPTARTLEVYHWEPGPRWSRVAAHAGDEHVRAAPFEAIELELGALWPDDDEAAEPAVGGRQTQPR